MLLKCLSVALLAVGVIGRTVYDSTSVYFPYEYDPYESYSRKFLSEYCNGNVTTENVAQVKSSIKTITQCVAGLIDRENAVREFGEATVNNDYTEVFRKYCALTPDLKDCIKPLYTDLALCLSAEQIRIEEKVTNDLLEFTCGNDGARLASFFKEDGAQCVQQKLQVMSSCIESTDIYAKSLKGARINGAEMGCEDRGQVMTCLVKGLKECQNPVPGNLAEEFREVVMKSHQCPNKEEETQTAVVVESNTKQDGLPQTSLLDSAFIQQLELLKKRKLELEVRTAELEAWNRENELRVVHSSLTSDIKRRL